MPSNVTAKIKSALKRREAIAFLLVVLISGCAYALLTHTPPRTLHTSERSYRLEVADTASKQERGLSGRSALAPGQGMLFVFDREESLCFWMKDMQFPIDIIWLDAGRRVVGIEQHIEPGTYPQEFCSHTPGKYVIELSAGEIAKAQIRKGQTLRF